jgi:hypothetical protein
MISCGILKLLDMYSLVFLFSRSIRGSLYIAHTCTCIGLFFCENAKSFAFRCIDGKESLFTHVQARTSQHCIIQLNPLDLSHVWGQGTYANRSHKCSRSGFRSNCVTETGCVWWRGVENSRVAMLPDPPCCEHDQRRSPFTNSARGGSQSLLPPYHEVLSPPWWVCRGSNP